MTIVFPLPKLSCLAYLHSSIVIKLESNQYFCYPSSQKRKSRALASCTTHSTPSRSSSLLVLALQRTIVHLCVLMASSPSPWTDEPTLSVLGSQYTWSLTCCISELVMQSSISVLLANTKRLAPINRFSVVSMHVECDQGPPTSSTNKPASSARQSSIRRRSVASTTQTNASVFSK